MTESRRGAEMTPEELQQLLEQIKSFLLLANACLVLGAVVVGAVTARALMRFRLDRQDEILFGKGSNPGLVREIEDMKLNCARNHPRIHVQQEL
jgi:hypothetical protein